MNPMAQLLAKHRIKNEVMPTQTDKNDPDQNWDQYDDWSAQRLMKFIWGLLMILKGKFSK